RALRVHMDADPMGGRVGSHDEVRVGRPPAFVEFGVKQEVAIESAAWVGPGLMNAATSSNLAVNTPCSRGLAERLHAHDLAAKCAAVASTDGLGFRRRYCHCLLEAHRFSSSTLRSIPCQSTGIAAASATVYLVR